MSIPRPPAIDEPALERFERAQRVGRLCGNLAIYIFGVAIGCALLGALALLRQPPAPASPAPAPAPAATPPGSR